MRRAVLVGAAWAALVATPSSPTLKIFTERLPGTTVEFEMVYIPPGKIELPDPDDPSKTRVVAIQGFWIGRTEVTWDEYGTYAFNKEIHEIEKQRGADAVAKPSKPYGAIDRGFGYEGNPAIGMTFAAAQRYCEWLSKITGKNYRLPNEAEWEYAARAGVLARALLSRDIIDRMAWHAENSDLKPHKVKQKQPNAWGLYDVLGNVMEWCFGLDGKAVACGGAFTDKPEQVHPGARARQTPEWNMTDPQYPKSRWWLSDAPFVGLRVACDAPAPD
ncbi:MAG: formylglycine-generating enzyme family protein [Armatimonadota bacterium]|nr:formylglycine-generating enzyme family protein [Armatimonadota bacterium]